MDDCIQLEATEWVAERPFANVDRQASDLVAARQMLERLRRLLGQPGAIPENPRPFILDTREGDGRCHRVVISSREGLLANRDLTVVGFFGHKRPVLDPALVDEINAMDARLIDEFLDHPGVLSYSSLELEDRNYGNLVLLDPPEAKEHWRTSAKHTYAARVLAPAYYLTIRLHNGLLPGGLLLGGDLILLRTKYYDFQGHQPWRAVREFGPATA